MVAVELAGVTKTIKGNDVVSNVSLKIKKGTVVGLRGINGSGKTMLMRLVAGLIKPSEGSVCINGSHIDGTGDFPKDIGLLIENPAFLGSYSGFENLSLLASIKNKIQHSDILRVLDDVGLSDAKKKKYRKYSLGMKQRLGIAAAIMEQPGLILLDEPTNALDDAGIEMVKRLVAREKERGATFIIACHDKDILVELADEIVYMESGRITKIESRSETEG